MYVLVTAFDLSGATCRYRRRAEALSAVMHLSHVAAKALGCAGVPAYPLPAQPRRLYWMDVLACAMLSAVCEPVRAGRGARDGQQGRCVGMLTRGVGL